MNKNLNYLIDPTFNKVNKLFVLQFENEDDRISFRKYYTPTVKNRDYNAWVDGKSFFDILMKNNKGRYEKIVEMSKNNDYTIVNVQDYDYIWKHYKLISIDLNKQTELEKYDMRQQINFIGKPAIKDGATIFFIIEKS